MSKRGNLRVGSKRFKFHKFISNERKKELELHPQHDNFYFRNSGKGFNWYITTVFGEGCKPGIYKINRK